MAGRPAVDNRAFSAYIC